jgi:hypothetical protein
MTHDPVTLAALAMAVAFTMAYAGTKKRALELRRRTRRCPSCGRRIEGRVCDAH